MNTPSGTDKIGRGAAFTESDDMSATLAQNWWAVALRGVFAIIFGLVALLLPGATILSLVLIFSAYMLVDGIFAIISAVRAARRNRRWGMLVLEGIVDIATGAVAFLLPTITVLAFVLLMGAWAIVSGGLMFASAFRLRRRYGRWWLALGGLASLIFGVLLIASPLVGAVVLTWWLGAYALVFGTVLLVLAFQLRSRRNESPDNAALQGA
jgi:uncharacterized membrane protein HdeD (DUF308 family)